MAAWGGPQGEDSRPPAHGWHELAIHVSEPSWKPTLWPPVKASGEGRPSCISMAGSWETLSQDPAKPLLDSGPTVTVRH